MRWLLFTLPFAVQSLAMAVDEGHFHRRRGLPRWERIGHPLDTLTVFACYAYVLIARPHAATITGFVALALFSCLFVTKDEPVHARHCPPGEQWLHALLFVLHPMVLGGAGLMWPAAHAITAHDLPIYLDSVEGPRAFLWGALASTLLFGMYQILYWNGPWRRRAA